MTVAKPALSTYDELRAKFIRETETALTLGLMFPGSYPRIPTVKFGSGSFTRGEAEAFWFDAAGIAYAVEVA